EEAVQADPARFAEVLRARYGRDVLDPESLESITTLRELMAAASVPIETVPIYPQAVVAQLINLGSGASALVADVSLTEWRDGFQTQILFLHNDDGIVYVELESGEWQELSTALSLAASRYEASRSLSLFERMLRGPGAIYQTHAIICDPQGTVVP